MPPPLRPYISLCFELLRGFRWSDSLTSRKIAPRDTAAIRQHRFNAVSDTPRSAVLCGAVRLSRANRQKVISCGLRLSH